MNQAIQTIKPIGNAVAVGAIPGAMILSADNGETMAINPDCIPELIEKMGNLMPFTSKDQAPILANDWPVKNGQGQ